MMGHHIYFFVFQRQDLGNETIFMTNEIWIAVPIFKEND